MPVETHQCPNCGAPLKLTATRACVFCGAAIQVTTPEGKPDRAAIARAVDTNGAFALEVEDVFAIRGRGTVVTGCVGSGTVRVGDELVVEGPRGTKTTRCKGIEMFRKVLEKATAGDQVGLMLEGIERDDVARGSWIRAVAR